MSAGNLKTIFLSLPYPMTVRNLLRNPFFDYLTQRFRVVIFSSFHNDPEFIREFKRENVFFEPLLFDFKKNIFDRQLFKAHRFGDRYFFTHRKSVHGKPLQKIIKEKFGKRDEYLARMTGKLFILFPCINAWLTGYVQKMYVSRYYQQKIDQYKPSFIFSTHPFVDSDIQMVINAKRKGIPTASMIHSWDNLTSKGRMLENPDSLVVWNDIMRDEALALYPQLETEKICVSGIPQHDYLVNDNWVMERSEFLKSIGADPSKKVITYISRGGKYSNYKENENISAILEALRKNGFAEGSQLIIREVHLLGRTQYRTTLGPQPHVVYDVPDISFHPTMNDQYRWSNNPQSLYHLGNLLKHSDVVINYASTITLDALYFDVPIIWPIYEWKEMDDRAREESGSHELENSHLQPILKSQAVQLADSPAHLVEIVNEALQDPSRFSSQRKKLCAQYNPEFDGNAGIRIAKFIERLIS